jgi:hypothetical protein
MKAYKLLLRSLYFLLAISLLNCGKTKNDPQPGGGTAANLTITAFGPSTGSAGDRVVITGTGYSTTLGNNKVKFGNTEAPLDSAYATRLVVRVPKDIVSGKIFVEVGGKTVASATDFTVQQKPVSFFGTAATANTASGVTVSEAKITSSIDKEVSNSVIQHGHIWSLSRAEPTLEGFDAATEGKTELGSLPAGAAFPFKFESFLNGLQPNTTYNLRPYATTTQGTTYGSVGIVRTKQPCKIESILREGYNYMFTRYDSQGRMTYLAFYNNSGTFTYDDAGYLTKYQETLNNKTKTEVTYAYTKGQISKVEQTRTGEKKRTKTYEYDTQDKLVIDG